MARPPLDEDKFGLLQGTLDMLILQTLRPGPAHGHQIATAIERTSHDVLQVDHGSLYPALHRLIKRGWITGTWQPVVKAPLHSIGAASRLAALLLGHKCPNLLPRRALPAGRRANLGATRGSTTGCWGTSTNNRRAKFYSLTPAGRRQLVRESHRWERMVEAVARVMQPANAEE